jgi:hypothetical protein
MRLSRSDLELEVLYNRIKRGELDLQPDFQRGEVWDRARQARLIDTILREWYVPAIHIVREKDDQRELVLDGQQRLQAIKNFFDGQLRVDGTLDPESDEIFRLNRRTYAELPEEYQRKFNRFTITVVTLTDYDPAEPSELFFRLNQQYSLTPPEKRNALFGAARDQVKRVVSHLIDIGALHQAKIGFTNGRLAYDDVIARFCIALQHRTLRIQISNNYVEQFYRHEQFDLAVIDEAVRAGETLGEALDIIGRVKFNKATLFSWLIFVHSDVINTKGLPAFIGEFESARSRISNAWPQPIPALIKSYNDRSSYRVGDVNSVLIRDIVIHCAHYIFVNPVGPERQLSSILDQAYLDEDTEYVLLNFIRETDWGAEI